MKLEPSGIPKTPRSVYLLVFLFLCFPPNWHVQRQSLETGWAFITGQLCWLQRHWPSASGEPCPALRSTSARTPGPHSPASSWDPFVNPLASWDFEGFLWSSTQRIRLFNLHLLEQTGNLFKKKKRKKNSVDPKELYFFLSLLKAFIEHLELSKAVRVLIFCPWPPGFIAAVFWAKAPYRNPSGLHSGSLGDWMILEAVSLYKPSQLPFVICHLLSLWGSPPRIFSCVVWNF